MSEAFITPDDFERCIAPLFPPFIDPSSCERFADTDFDRISTLLRQVGKVEWSQRPRTYAVLRLINRVGLMSHFVLEGLFDIAFPYVESQLPSALNSPTLRHQFIQVQSLVLTKASDLEIDGGRHRHLGTCTTRALRSWRLME
jgi:hypothetical protein